MSSPSPHTFSSRGLLTRPLGPLRGLLGSRFASALAYPHSIDHYLELVSPLWSVDRIRAEVEQVVCEAPGVVTLVLRPNENFRGYAAGQYVAVTVDVDGARHTRCFSLSSTPRRRDGRITITVKARAQGGWVSPYLVEHAHPGMRLLLSEPQGTFVLPDILPERLLFISGGSGITPCMGMLRTLLADGHEGPIVFVHYARSPRDVIFGDELRQLAHAHTNLTLVIETEAELGRMPQLTVEALAQIAPAFETWSCWVCGPAPLMDAACNLYRARDAEARVRTEQFVLAPSQTSSEGKAGRLQLARSGRQIEGDTRTLLEQAEAAGARPKSGCRMGICQTCRCTKLRGVTRNLRTGELSTGDNTSIQLCVHVPVGDVSLDL